MYSLHKGHVKMEAEVDIDAATNQRTPRIAGNHQNLKETRVLPTACRGSITLPTS